PTVSGLLALMKQKTSYLSSPAQVPDGSDHSISGQGIDSHQFLEIIRKGEGKPVLICVGNSAPVPFLLPHIPATIPILLLKLDGTPVWPPRYLTLEEQLAVFVQAIENHCASRSAVLLGFSYCGFLAYRLASVLQERGWSEVNPLMVEPSVPDRYQPFSTR